MIRILTCETLYGQFIVHTPPTTPQTMPDLSCKPEYALHRDDEIPKQHITLAPYKTWCIPHSISSCSDAPTSPRRRLSAEDEKREQRLNTTLLKIEDVTREIYPPTLLASYHTKNPTVDLDTFAGL